MIQTTLILVAIASVIADKSLIGKISSLKADKVNVNLNKNLLNKQSNSLIQTENVRKLDECLKEKCIYNCSLPEYYDPKTKSRVQLAKHLTEKLRQASNDRKYLSGCVNGIDQWYFGNRPAIYVSEFNDISYL
jgi:hypothetical protein